VISHKWVSADSDISKFSKVKLLLFCEIMQAGNEHVSMFNYKSWENCIRRA